MLKVTHGVGIGRIRKQDVAVWRAADHRAKIECHESGQPRSSMSLA